MMNMPRSEFFNFIYSFYKSVNCEDLIKEKANKENLENYFLRIIEKLNQSYKIKFDFHIKNPERIIQYKKDKDYTIVLEKIEGDDLFDEKFYMFDVISNIDLDKIASFGFIENKKGLFYYELKGNNVYYELMNEKDLLEKYKNKIMVCYTENKENIDENIVSRAYLINFLKERLQDLEVDIVFSKSLNLNYLFKSIGLIKETYFLMIKEEDITFSKEFVSKLNDLRDNKIGEESVLREFEEFDNKKIIKII